MGRLDLSLLGQLRETAHVRQDVHVRRQPYEEYFDEMCFCPVLDFDGADAYQVKRERIPSVISAEHSLMRIDQIQKLMPYAPRSSTPQAKSFFERRRVRWAAEVIQPETGVTNSSNDCFSSELFVGSRILAGSSIVRST